MAYRETMENNGMEAGKSKEPNPVLYSGVGSVECHSFSDRTDPAQSRRMDGIGGLSSAWRIFS